MLQHMRDNSKGVISGILIGLLVIIFAISGAEALFTWDASAGKVLSVNGESISETDVARAISMRKQQILSRYGETVPPEFLTDEKLRQPAIDGLIQRSLMIQAAKKGGLSANTDNLHKDILATSAFHKEGGVFDQAKYVQLLGYQGFTPASYQAALADDSVINQLQDSIAYTAFVTPVELKNIVGLSFQTRSFSYAIIPADKVEKAVVVSDDDIQAHYAANPQSFTLPERVAVDYIELSTAELMKNITISDEQAQKQFEQNSKNFIAKVEREAAHILLDDNALPTAVEVKAKLDAGEDFAALAKQYSTDTGSKEQGGALGLTAGDAFPAEFEAALAKLKVGEVSAPVKTSAGIHIIKLLAERGAQPPTFAESKAAIIEQLKSAEADTQFAEKIKRLGDASYNADNLAVVAKELGLTLQNTQLFAKEGGKDLTANPLFVAAAFSPEVLEQGNASDVIELDPSRVLVLKKTDRKPSELQPLDAVKTKIVEVVRAEKTQALLAQQAQSFIAALSSGKSMAEQAKATGVEVKTLAAATRSEKDADRELLQYVFKLPTPVAPTPVLGSVTLAKGDLAVVSLTAVNLGAEDKVPAEQKASIATQLANINGEYDLKSVQTHLQEVADIERK